LLFELGGPVGGLPILSAPQLAMLFVIRKSNLLGLRAFFLAASIIMVGFYWFFLQSVDLTGSSTAGIGLFFFPLYLGFGSLVAGAAILWLQRLTAGELD
jgi:hypothetical protein